MKRNIFLTLLTILTISCSDSESIPENTQKTTQELLIGKWNLKVAIINSDGSYEDLNDCNRKSYMSIKTSTIDNYAYVFIGNECYEEFDLNTNYRVDNEIIEIMRENNGSTEIISRTKVNFINNNLMELFKVQSNGTVNEIPSDIWERETE
ncbi:lipocalin family protein [Tenacibaculum sp. nBUS_03]|uniref:lipocalin family protein n=1 Tax=Tenacibaculum sp. nBUS_03 TaxID=3395320 RepID=UPI003EBF1A7C